MEQSKRRGRKFPQTDAQLSSEKGEKLIPIMERSVTFGSAVRHANPTDFSMSAAKMSENFLCGLVQHQQVPLLHELLCPLIFRVRAVRDLSEWRSGKRGTRVELVREKSFIKSLWQFAELPRLGRILARSILGVKL